MAASKTWQKKKKKQKGRKEIGHIKLILKAPRPTIVKFASSIDPDEVAHNEPPHPDQHYLPSSL